MFRRGWFGVAAALALLAQPVMAQDGPAGEDMLAGLMGLFAAKPLTAEEEARLPAARVVVEKVLPPGTMGEMFGSMMDGLLGPIMNMATKPSASDAAKMLGFESYELELDQDQAAGVMAILDPNAGERSELTMTATKGAIGKLMLALEPTVKDTMTELYAVHFDDRELADIGVFFSTESGANYARKSYTMAGDPRMISGMMKALPGLMGSFAEMETDLKAATAGVPPPKTFADLDGEQLARLSELTGLSEEEISEGMNRAASGAEGEDPFADYDWDSEGEAEEVPSDDYDWDAEVAAEESSSDDYDPDAADEEPEED